MANTAQASVQTEPIESDQNKLLKEIHDIGWGKPWPSKPCTIDRHEILLNETDNGHKEMCVDRVDNSDIPATETFKCLLNVDLLRTALRPMADPIQLQAIIVLREYEYLRESLENESKAWHFIVTGEQGTGKTLFILYLLLYRLEKKLPTAVQFSGFQYILFDAEGVSLRPTTISVDSEMIPCGCWCISDGNAYVDYPCEPFMQGYVRTFLVTSANLETYKRWRNETGARTVVKAVPRMVEMAAIAKMHGFQPCDAVSVSQRWGPNIRTIFDILRDRRYENVYWDHEAKRIYQESLRMVANKEGTWLQKVLNLFPHFN